MKMSVRDINVEFRFFLIKCFVKYDFLEFTKYSTWLTVQIWAAKCESGRYNKFWMLLSPHQKLFFFFVDLKMSEIRILDMKLATCMCHLIVHRFLARVHSPASTENVCCIK